MPEDDLGVIQVISQVQRFEPVGISSVYLRDFLYEIFRWQSGSMF